MRDYREAFAVAAVQESLWSGSADCGGMPCERRLGWYMGQHNMSFDGAVNRVMQEYPLAFKPQPPAQQPARHAAQRAKTIVETLTDFKLVLHSGDLPAYLAKPRHRATFHRGHISSKSVGLCEDAAAMGCFKPGAPVSVETAKLMTDAAALDGVPDAAISTY